jgi:CDGSH-type Zn-finger protein/uncharacterized Fe-S cluster protein YjdI
MDSDPKLFESPTREKLVHALYEAAELEHNLMCTYLYAAFSLKSPGEQGLSDAQGEAVAGWRRALLDVAIDEMGHLAAVWNVTAALGAAPRFGRTNFPLDPGYLPAGVVVKLAAFNQAVLQHFIHLERPHGSTEPDGEGFAPERVFQRGSISPRLTPMGADYATVGDFYAMIGRDLRLLAERVGEQAAFCGDPALQLSAAETALPGIHPVKCLKTALAAFDAIVAQGEGAPADTAHSHFQRFIAVREDYRALLAQDPGFVPAHPAAHNPVLRRPPRPEGRVWIEAAEAGRTVDAANAMYGLMLRLLAYSYTLPSPAAEKALAADLAAALMRAMTQLGEHAARLPAGPSNPECHAGVSFVALRDAAALPAGAGARTFFVERFDELTQALHSLTPDAAGRIAKATGMMSSLTDRAKRGFAAATPPPAVPVSAPPALAAVDTPEARVEDGVEIVEGRDLTLLFETRRCIHARFCVTGAPAVFLANVQGPWIHPDAMDTEALAGIARICPSGAIRYRRKDGRPDEADPPVNLLAVREAGPYAVHAPILLDGVPAGFRATLCRCGASRNKPFCDSSHHDIGFAASGEPATGSAEALAVRNGQLAIDPQLDGPLQVRGNLEITSGTGRVVARIQSARLCRCGASQNKPFCDNSHERIGFKSENGAVQMEVKAAPE